MPTSRYNWILILFAVAALTNLYAELTSKQMLVYCSKPLLMLTLVTYFGLSTPKSKFKNWILLGIVFAMFGDIFLMLNGRHGADNSPMFLYGLGSFLLTHVFYTLAFVGYPRKMKGFLQQKPLWLLPFLVYFILFWYNMYQYIPSELMLPVAVYSSVIVIMAMAAMNLSNKIPRTTANILLLGVLLFVFSDTCIALNKFTDISLPAPGLVIMLTYILGQLTIVLGATKIAQEC